MGKITDLFDQKGNFIGVEVQRTTEKPTMNLTTFIEEKRKEFVDRFSGVVRESPRIVQTPNPEMESFLESSLKELAHRMIAELPEKTHRTQLELGTVHTFDGVTAWNVGFRFYRQEALRKLTAFLGE